MNGLIKGHAQVTEGEFFLRIEIKHRKLIGKGRPVNPNLHEDWVKQLLQEAKQEFPSYFEVEAGLLKSNRSVVVENARQMLVHCIYDWFEKWFGEKAGD